MHAGEPPIPGIRITLNDAPREVERRMKNIVSYL
jgi:hypothetical protein